MTALLPRPVSAVCRDDWFVVDAGTCLAGDVDRYGSTVRWLLASRLDVALPTGERGITLRHDPALPDEGYRLSVRADGITLAASTARGMGWACQTLLQLTDAAVMCEAPLASSWRFEGIEIEDAPRFGWRGSMLDVGRHYMPVADVLRHLRWLAFHKYNVFHLHLTDDQGWRFESKRYPRLTQVGAWRPESISEVVGGDGTPHGGFYTQDQLRAIVAYADRLGITVVPEVEFPGHAIAALAAYPEFGVGEPLPPHAAALYDVHDFVLNLGDEAMAFVRDIWDEVLDIFPARYVHIGGDEVPTKQWVGYEPVERLARQVGLDDASQIQRWFTQQLRDYLIGRGRVPIGWDEIIDHGIVDGMVCMSWRGAEPGQRAARAGMATIMASNGGTYFDYYQSASPDEPLAMAGSCTLEVAQAYDPLAGLDGDACANVLGTQFQLWTECLPTMRAVEYMAWPRGCAHAEVAWSGSGEFEEFSTRLAEHLRRLDAGDINYRPLDGPRPEQRGGTGLRRRPG